MKQPTWRSLELSKNRRLVTAQYYRMNSRDVKTVHVKGYWNYWKYRIILYVSQNEHYADRSKNRRLLGTPYRKSVYSKTGIDYVIGKKLCIIDACKELIADRYLNQAIFNFFNKLYLG